MRFYRVLLPIFLLTGCANDPAPNEQMRLTAQALEQAQAVGADATLDEYRLATEKYALARKNMGEQDYKRARMLAEEAELDARVAEVRELTTKSDEQLAAVNARIERLRERLGEAQ